MLITNVILLFLAIVLICTVPGSFLLVPLRILMGLIPALIFGIFKFGMDWVEERASRPLSR